jgi:hypothetical protein
VQGEHLVVAERVRQHDRQERLAGLGAHRGEVRQRAGQRAVAGVSRRPAVAEAEVRAVDHHVDRHRGDAVRAQDRAVVADPPQHARVRPPPEDALDRADQAQLAQEALPVAVDDPRAIEVVGRDLHAHSVTGQDADAEAPHLAGDVPEHLVAVVELHPEHRVRQRFDDLSLELDLLFLRQA